VKRRPPLAPCGKEDENRMTPAENCAEALVALPREGERRRKEDAFPTATGPRVRSLPRSAIHPNRARPERDG